VKLKPDDVEARIGLGKAYKTLGEGKKAVKEFERAISLMSARDSRKMMLEYQVRDLRRRFSD